MKQRKHIDCRNYPSDMNCTISISADSEKDLIEAAVQHAVSVNGHQGTPDLCMTLQTMMKNGAVSA